MKDQQTLKYDNFATLPLINWFLSLYLGYKITINDNTN